MNDTALTVGHLEKSYDDMVALDGVSLDLARGDVVGLLGPNGAGKTTLVSIICGLRRADAGSVSVCGIDALAHPQKARPFIGLAPQDLGIYPIDKVKQNLALFGELTGLHGAALNSQIETVATALRLTDLLDRKAGELSGGQKRRLHTAIALLNDPPLILLDEATTGADVETRAALISVVNDLARRGSAVLYSTHYLGEIEALDARVVILDKGQVIAEGSVAELTSRNGASFVEMTFDGLPPPLDGFETTSSGSVIRIRADDPAREMGGIFSAVGAAVERLQTVEIIGSSLETVFLELTGRRYEPEGELDVMAS